MNKRWKGRVISMEQHVNVLQSHQRHRPTIPHAHSRDARDLLKRLAAARNGTPMPRRRGGVGGWHDDDDSDLAAFVQGTFGGGGGGMRQRGGVRSIGGGEDDMHGVFDHLRGEDDVLHFD